MFSYFYITIVTFFKKIGFQCQNVTGCLVICMQKQKLHRFNLVKRDGLCSVTLVLQQLHSSRKLAFYRIPCYDVTGCQVICMQESIMLVKWGVNIKLH